jgi:uncharacterized protein (DUF2235 family)
MKRIVFCFDGTWNRLDAPFPTNVVTLAQSVSPHARDGTTQIIHYDQGVGTGDHDRFSGGLFGAGLLDHLANAYRFLIFNYEVGDEIYVFGFSRGAYTARAFVGFLRNSGIIERRFAGKISQALELYRSRQSDTDDRSAETLGFRAKYAPDICVDEQEDAWRCENCKGYVGHAEVLRVRYLGVWDTVGSLGVPDTLLIAPLLNRRYKFYDTSLTDMVAMARHAVAIDERRKSFSPTLWTNLSELNGKLGFSGGESDAPYQQQWFPGVHGGVGGGGDIRGLSDAALDWVMSGARDAGLELDVSEGSVLFGLNPDYLAPLDNVTQKGFSLLGFAMGHLPQTDRSPGPRNLAEVSATAKSRWLADPAQFPDHQPYRPKPLSTLTLQLKALADGQSAPADDNPPSPSPPHPPEQGARPPFHTVIKGDTLTGIAFRYYGAASASDSIWKANRMLTDPNRIYIGQVLRLPDTGGV